MSGADAAAPGDAAAGAADLDTDDLDDAVFLALGDDPLVRRLEQLNAELLIPNQALERLEIEALGRRIEGHRHRPRRATLRAQQCGRPDPRTP